MIVAYGGEDLLRRCLHSLVEHPLARGPLTVHVVDNASPDATPDMVAREFPQVKLHRLSKNAGFSVANNIVLRTVQAPVVLVLNPDTELCPGALDHVLDSLDEHPGVGIVGCRLVRLDGSFDHAAKRSFPTAAAAAAHFAGFGQRLANGRLAQYRATDLDEHGVGEVDAVNGAFMLVRAAALHDVGLLDEGYWMYAEDLDWCRRFWNAGWKVLYDGRVTVLHIKSGSAGANRALRPNWHFHRGMGRFYRRHESGAQPLLDIVVYAAIVIKFLLSAVRSAMNRSRRPYHGQP